MSVAARLSWQGCRGAGGAWLRETAPLPSPLGLGFYVALQAQRYILRLRRGWGGAVGGLGLGRR